MVGVNTCVHSPPADRDTPRHDQPTGALGSENSGERRTTVSAVTISLREITDANVEPVLQVRTTAEQERFVSTVADSLAEAAANPQGNPWYRAIYVEDQPVGFVMLSWDVEAQPPHINGPWFLWKLLIDSRYQRRGYGREVLRQVVELVREHGATELLTSYVPGDGGPAGFYARLGFLPRGDVDPDGEIILRLALQD